MLRDVEVVVVDIEGVVSVMYNVHVDVVVVVKDVDVVVVVVLDVELKWLLLNHLMRQLKSPLFALII